MDLLQKSINQITFSDIQFLIDSKIQENCFLEYKGADFLNRNKNPENYEKHKGNLIEKIAGFANNHGGLIILGIKEDNQTKKPIEIQSPEIENFEQLLARTIMNGLQPSINVEWTKIINPKNLAQYVIVIKVEESDSPVMLYLKGYKEGVFPIRIGEDTKIADLFEVELLFQKKGPNIRIKKAAIDIFQTLFKIFYYNSGDMANTEIKFAMLKRIITQYKSILPELGFVPDDENSMDLYVLDHFLIAPFNVINLSHPNSDQPNYIEMLIKLYKFWKKHRIIWLKPEDFDEINLRTQQIFSFD